ncbi:hypothetical protein CPB83DRAFT_864955 [Crepidotus variabilis]|uniref:Uncharacterized protein n=1 Tax=Crepidotus variabilis TaxID=179855 RepID=A0A9P6JIM0_9AGAR|nr:hypothetical protein CPB83DRAFT_864955 [Crepidotus variabilis]
MPAKKRQSSKIAQIPTTVKSEPAVATAPPTNFKRETKKGKNKVLQVPPPAPATVAGHNDSTEFPPFIDTIWKTVVLPTLYQRLNSSTSPFLDFAKNSEALLENIEAVLTKVFPGHTYTPTRTSYVVKQACKRITERRGTIASTAVQIVDQFFDSGEFKNNPKAIATYVKWAVKPSGPAFWSRPEPQIESDNAPAQLPDGFAQSRFVLKTVAPFLNVKGAVADFGNPVGAFGLALGAIERAFSLYETGTKPNQDNIPEFSGDKNGGMIEDYIHNLKKFSEGRWVRVFADVAKISGIPPKPAPTTTKVTASVARVRRDLFTPSSPPPESS